MKTRIAAIAAFSLLAFSAADARVTKIVIDTKVSPAFGGTSFGTAGQYETLAGRAWGELDPNHPNNSIITDIDLAERNPLTGKVEYMATFFIVKPIDMSRASGLMWHDVPNRGGRITISTDLRAAGDVGLSSGWQGDNSGNTAHSAAGREIVVVPVARNPNGTPIRGRVMGRIINASGVNSSPIIVHSNPIPYRPVDLNSAQDTLTEISSETITGVTGATRQIPRGDWAWAKCGLQPNPVQGQPPIDFGPFPGAADPTHICVRGGFAANKVHQVVFTAQDPYVLGIGFAAFRDLASFFKNDMQDSQQPATVNPVAGNIRWVLARGSSQSGNFLRAFLHLGFNQDEMGRQVQDGNWPIIAGRRVSLNTRFAMPDGVLKLYEPGSEGPQWWHKFPDHKRGLPPAGILDRCHATGTCPKIIEHFGSAEIWGLKLGPEWVGTDPRNDIPLPPNVRRYYIASTPHGGGDGGFSNAPGTAPNCPSSGYGVGTFGDNPMPHTQTVNAIRYHFRRWVMQDILPPDSVWPRKHQGNLVQPTKAAMGFPSLPGMPATAPTGLINPVLDYDFGPDWDYTDASGVTSVVPPRVKQVIPSLVPKVDSDGNELGGVPVVLREAPLGTYMGWNIVNGGFHNGKICNYAGGWIPFAKTKDERGAKGDPRLSLQERYGNHTGYMNVVRAAAARAVAAGFLLQADADALIAQANASTAFSGL
jgi:hypothetical protein